MHTLRKSNHQLKTNESYKVTISLASNFEQERNLSEARQRLRQILTNEQYTDALWTEPFCSCRKEKYLNQLVFAFTSLNAEDIISAMKDIETSMGRTPKSRNNGIVSIDLDLMEHNGTRYHLNDWERPYIKTILDNCKNKNVETPRKP